MNPRTTLTLLLSGILVSPVVLMVLRGELTTDEAIQRVAIVTVLSALAAHGLFALIGPTPVRETKEKETDLIESAMPTPDPAPMGAPSGLEQ